MMTMPVLPAKSMKRILNTFYYVKHMKTVHSQKKMEKYFRRQFRPSFNCKNSTEMLNVALMLQFPVQRCSCF